MLLVVRPGINPSRVLAPSSKARVVCSRQQTKKTNRARPVANQKVDVVEGKGGRGR